jgi:hypothetical protein
MLGGAWYGLVACVTGHVNNHTAAATRSTGTTDMLHPDLSIRRPKMCKPSTPCPPADAIDHDAARITASFPEQGWSLLCNGVIVFDDTGELMPDGSTVAPHRGPAPHKPVLAAA